MRPREYFSRQRIVGTQFEVFAFSVLWLSASWLGSSSAWAQSAPDLAGKRVVDYDQTLYCQGKYVSLAKIWQQVNPKTHKPITTESGLRLQQPAYIHLHDNVPSDPIFKVMRKPVATLEKNGVSVRLMPGGAAQGSCADLSSTGLRSIPSQAERQGTTIWTGSTWTSQSTFPSPTRRSWLLH